jgi:hypothetical protein
MAASVWNNPHHRKAFLDSSTLYSWRVSSVPCVTEDLDKLNIFGALIFDSSHFMLMPQKICFCKTWLKILTSLIVRKVNSWYFHRAQTLWIVVDASSFLDMGIHIIKWFILENILAKTNFRALDEKNCTWKVCYSSVFLYFVLHTVNKCFALFVFSN